MAVEELDEIAQLEAAGQKLMAEPISAPRRLDAADAKRASTADSVHVEALLAEIRDRLDLLLQANGSSQGANPSQGSLPETPRAPDTSVSATEETDEFRKEFPHEEAGLPAAATVNIMLSEPDMTRLLAAVEDRVTRHALMHHSSVVVLLGWAMSLLSAGLGMGYGYIVASGRYPFWAAASHASLLSSISAAILGAPVGVVLLPLAGAILWATSKEVKTEKKQAIWRLAAIGVFLAGILLPLTTML
ncbi:MAG: hypothetical protein OWQ56_00290 [Acidithiobacillus caldus]|nr:hypothetical protein [Acidithiobacillus caldus]